MTRCEITDGGGCWRIATEGRLFGHFTTRIAAFECALRLACEVIGCGGEAEVIYTASSGQRHVLTLKDCVPMEFAPCWNKKRRRSGVDCRKRPKPLPAGGPPEGSEETQRLRRGRAGSRAMQAADLDRRGMPGARASARVSGVRSGRGLEAKRLSGDGRPVESLA